MALSRTANGITYTDNGLTMAQRYTDDAFAMRYNAECWNGMDGHQEFVRLAAISQGESVLDFACGTGLAGLLACEVLGGRQPDVYFVDMSMPMLRSAKAEAQRRHPQIPNNHFQRAADLRDPQLCRAVLQQMGKPGGFDVILAKLILSHFTTNTQSQFIAHLRALLAPGGRLVIDHGPLSPSRAYAGGSPDDEVVVGMRQTRLTADWGQISEWKMGYRLQVISFTTMVTTGDRNRGKDELRRVVQGGGGVPGAWVESFNRANATTDMAQTLVQRASQNKEPAGANPSVQQDLERRREVTRMLAAQGETVAFVPGRPVTFRMMFNIAMVVR